MSYTNEQLTELVNGLGFLDPQSLKPIPLMLGQLVAFKSKTTRNNKEIEPGDVVMRFWENEFITTRFHGGNRNQLTNFKKLTITTDEN